MRTMSITIAAFVCLMLPAVTISQDTLPPGGRPAGPQAAAPTADVHHQQVSYALGRNFARNLQQNKIAVDMKLLLAGISDALSGAQPKFNDDQCTAALQRFSQEMQQKAMAQNERDGAKNSQAAVAFLAQNAKREGVQSTASGLQYRVIVEGDGPSPTLNDVVRCNYRGSLLDGTEFDSSAQHGGPAEFPVSGVIPGWTEALQKMKVGDKWQLFIPPDLAYGANPPGPPIEANSLLVFEIELLGIQPQ
jgi:FKBP-type peptidyl-prolyl cis-trans isomerase FklB